MQDPASAARRRAILLVLGEALAFSLVAAMIKLLGGAIPLAEVMLFRNLFALPALMPQAMAHGGWRALRTRAPLGHLQRSGWGLLAMGGSFYGYAHLPLALASALTFTMPLFLTVFSVPLLGDRVGPRRASAVLVGFTGVLVMLSPGLVFGAGGDADTPDPVAVCVVLLSAIGWALAMISIRRMGKAGEPGVTIVLWFALSGVAACSIASLPVWVWPAAGQWALLAGIGMVSGIGQLLLTAAYRGGEAALLAPFEYSGLIWAALLGCLLWGEFPGLADMAGFLILVSAGLFIWRTEVTRRA
ncbi:DMT family transporter [Roseomonas gilardii subsp. gilardii]|uniref:DMT family transporter n=1 Tax=Roseomonas gilardii TaxID=257708 RepID=UPI001FF754EC|nr:DMT family transporter [Roseomonas gilardii]UPG71853.1 DMT family transporter [Roseomonas gilardii subsp. gilardii]